MPTRETFAALGIVHKRFPCCFIGDLAKDKVLQSFKDSWYGIVRQHSDFLDCFDLRTRLRDNETSAKQRDHPAPFHLTVNLLS